MRADPSDRLIVTRPTTTTENNVKDDDRERLVQFLRIKMCGPCRRDGARADHEGCVEAEALIAIVEADD
jgi:hypothetical protein